MYSKSCKYCIKGMFIPLTNDVLCRIKGVVSSNYVCSKFKEVPSVKTPRQLNYKCIDCKYFTQSISLSEDNSAIGTCILFCTRPFDGTNRIACKRFTLTKIHEVI